MSAEDLAQGLQHSSDPHRVDVMVWEFFLIRKGLKEMTEN
jgi:hypothetical protein